MSITHGFPSLNPLDDPALAADAAKAAEAVTKVWQKVNLAHPPYRNDKIVAKMKTAMQQLQLLEAVAQEDLFDADQQALLKRDYFSTVAHTCYENREQIKWAAAQKITLPDGSHTMRPDEEVEEHLKTFRDFTNRRGSFICENLPPERPELPETSRSLPPSPPRPSRPNTGARTR